MLTPRGSGVIGSYSHPYRRGLSYAAKAGSVAAAVGGIAMKAASRYMTPDKSKSVKTNKKIRRRFGPVKAQKSVKKQVKQLTKLVNADMGVHTQRRRSCGRVVCTSNQQTQTGFDVISSTLLEEVLAQLRYYDPSSPSALVNASGLTGSYQKDFLFSSIYANMTIRNNYQVPVLVRVYACRTKDDTSITPITAFTNGLVDVGNPASSSPLVYLSDSAQFRDLWSIEKTMIKQLNPGTQFSFKTATKSFSYDPSLYDSHNLEYMRRHHGLVYVVRVEGVISHDSAVTTEQSSGLGGVDIMLDTTFTVRYSAGAQIEYIYVDNETSAVTNGLVIANMPISDNQAFSVA